MALDMIRNKIKNIDIEVMFSVTEETSRGGAKTGAYNSDCRCMYIV
jgi:putative aminopeptidase FrvX